jgi:hypothetical protein
MKSFFLVFSVLVISLESFSFVLTKYNFFLVNNTPRIYNRTFDESSISSWRTEQDVWGSWHKKNSYATHESKCFSTKYISNSIGARDIDSLDFTYNSKIFNVALIGDSFAEGFGVNHGDRVGDILSKDSGLKINNYGSVDFGPLQYYLIYKNLIKSTPHDGVLIFLFPNNDFTDNDYSFWQSTGLTNLNNNKERWRPYYKKLANNSYDYFYPKNAAKRDHFGPTVDEDNLSISQVYSYTDFITSFKVFLIDHFYFSNALRTLETIFISNKINEAHKKPTALKANYYSGYYDSTIDQQKALLYYLNLLLLEIGSKPVIIFSIPTVEDLKRTQSSSRMNLYWWKKLNLINTMYSNVSFVDFADFITDDPTKLFHICDGHWNVNGNLLAAEVLLLKSNFLKLDHLGNPRKSNHK